jgi:EpsD family peptidyl-prolyl cis-trans isomerase
MNWFECGTHIIVDNQLKNIEKFLFLVAALAVMPLLDGCNGGGEQPKAVSRVVAKVNGDAISMQQIASMLGEAEGVAGEIAVEAKSVILDKLIDQQLVVQQAEAAGLGDNPKVVQAIDEARREILMRTYLEQIAAGQPKPSIEDAKLYYADHPELFSGRRVFTIQELRLAPNALPEAQRLVAEKKSISQITKDLEARKIAFTTNSGVRPAEQLPLIAAARLSDAKDGETYAVEMPTATVILHVVSSEKRPISEDKALPGIQQFLAKQRGSEAVAKEMNALRERARIERVGDLAETDTADAPTSSVDSAAVRPRRVSEGPTINAQDIAKGLAGL